MSAEFRLGIQSYCFRKFLPLYELIGVLKEAGLSYVEIWPRHIPWDDKNRVKSLEALRDHRISMDSYGQVVFTEDVDQARGVFEFAKAAGIRAITADVAPEAFDLMEPLCEEFGIRLAVHNHGRNHRYGHFDEIDAVFAKTSKQFGLCLDTAWLLDAGGDPLEAVDRYADRLYGVHLKDFVFDDEGKPEDVILGTGGLDLPVFMQRLKDVGFNGYLSIEYEGDADNPLPKVRECVKVMEEIIGSL